jgi:hypothetical protein
MSLQGFSSKGFATRQLSQAFHATAACDVASAVTCEKEFFKYMEFISFYVVREIGTAFVN